MSNKNNVIDANQDLRDGEIDSTVGGKNSKLTLQRNQIILGNWTSTCKKVKCGLISFTKINSKEIIGLNMITKTVKLLGEKNRG